MRLHGYRSTTTWHTASPNRSAQDRENTIIHCARLSLPSPAFASEGPGLVSSSVAGTNALADHGQELAPTNVNDAIPREYLRTFERAGLIDAERKRILGLDVEQNSDK